MIELDEEAEEAAGHGVRWRKGVLGLLFAVSCMNAAWGLVGFAVDLRRLAEFGPDFFATLASVLAAVAFARLLPYSERIERGAWVGDLAVLAALLVACRLFARADFVVGGGLWIAAMLLVYVGALVLYPFAHRLDTGRWRSDMLLVLGFLAGLAVLIATAWLR